MTLWVLHADSLRKATNMLLELEGLGDELIIPFDATRQMRKQILGESMQLRRQRRAGNVCGDEPAQPRLMVKLGPPQ